VAEPTQPQQCQCSWCERRRFWEFVDAVDAYVRDLPAWMKAGVVVDKEQFDG
jgi:hypothetical protein